MFRPPARILSGCRQRLCEGIGEWRRIQAEVKDLLRAGAAQDLNGIRFVNPFLSLIRFSAGTGFQVIAAHERRHLWQAERILANPRFP